IYSILKYKPSFFFKSNFTTQIGGRLIQNEISRWKYYPLPLPMENSLNHTLE
ncbi:hypothetical protein LDENG_00154180, partial [Lucifuga dentata]